MDDDCYFLANFWLNVTPLAECILLTLIFMLMWSLATVIEHAAKFYAAVWQSRHFLSSIKILLGYSDFAAVLQLAAAHKRSHIASVCAGGLLEFCLARQCLSLESSVDSGKRGARIAANQVHEQFRHGLTFLATIAATAPLVGMVGTIIGILGASDVGSAGKAMFIAAVAGSIAEALICTAAGLLVAILATWSFNWMRENLLILDAEMHLAAQELTVLFRATAGT